MNRRQQLEKRLVVLGKAFNLTQAAYERAQKAFDMIDESTRMVVDISMLAKACDRLMDAQNDLNRSRNEVAMQINRLDSETQDKFRRMAR